MQNLAYTYVHVIISAFNSSTFAGYAPQIQSR